MAEGASTTAMAASAYKTSVGQLKRFSQSWSSIMKRIYVTEEVLLEFRDMKNSGSFASDDSSLHYLLSHHTDYKYTSVWIGPLDLISL